MKTDAGVVMGTVQYMSPEQALGRDVDGRSDIFSLGVVLYELTTGRLPFLAGSPTETIQRIVTAQPDAVARFNYDAPVELERIIGRCLEKDPEDRYITEGSSHRAQAFAAGFRAGSGGRACPVGSKRSPWTGAGVALAYLRGRYHENRRTEDALRQAIVHFQEAIDGDPSYALA